MTRRMNINVKILQYIYVYVSLCVVNIYLSVEVLVVMLMKGLVFYWFENQNSDPCSNTGRGCLDFIKH